ncbi:pimeloyl-ACP methyl ester carboxylesterase [Methanolinea mesophila]|uniref:alpha/beta hydrolase n=1 Tax=Methanolinea mesophila TaxID=547055 RepID=UPI001AE5B47D|nr:alpha/beta hydrolase [Methanolinea mesophila]MBP1928602.1 pimeloyl-ACP methyl ester carboxylesterase [Methanolinea mesophila]
MSRGSAAPLLLLALVVSGLVISTGCTSPVPGEKSYSVAQDGGLSLSCGEPSVSSHITSQEGGVVTERLVFSDDNGPVYALLASPGTPRAAFVLAPGAGVKKEGHLPRALMYAREGYAFMVLDVRGNGGETPGYPLDFNADFTRFEKGEWPEYYLSICDMIHAEQYLSERYGVPVYAIGESNGGRYAAIAAALDPGYAGFIGISTSGFGRAGMQYDGDARRFLLSVDPDLYIEKIAPREVCIFHAEADPIIPFSEGEALYNLSLPPHRFVAFNGTHGINEEVDRAIIGECTQIYGVQG